MKRLIAVLLVLVCAARLHADPPAPPTPVVYPPAPRSDCVETLHGVQVADPYRGFEELDSEPTRAWVEAENKLTFRWLGEIAERPRLLERLTKLWNYEKWGVPRREGGRLFVGRNDGLQNQSALWVIDAAGAEPRVLLDPNALAKDGTVAVSQWAPSPDGK